MTFKFSNIFNFKGSNKVNSFKELIVKYNIKLKLKFNYQTKQGDWLNNNYALNKDLDDFAGKYSLTFY